MRNERGAGSFIKFVYWVARRRFGRVPTPVGIMAHQPWVLAGAVGFELSAERAKRVDIRLKELASIKAALEVGCRFCIDIGSAMARSHGVTEEELRDLVFHQSSTRLSTLDKQVLDYAVELTKTPMAVPRPLYEALEKALGAEALVELTAAIAWENFRARFNHAFGAKEEGYSTGELCLLPPNERLAESTKLAGSVE